MSAAADSSAADNVADGRGDKFATSREINECVAMIESTVASNTEFLRLVKQTLTKKSTPLFKKLDLTDGSVLKLQWYGYLLANSCSAFQALLVTVPGQALLNR